MKATWENLKPGTKVKCVFKVEGDTQCRYGQSARVTATNKPKKRIDVVWDDGDKRNTDWGRPSSFEVIEDNQLPHVPMEYEMTHGGVPLPN